VLKQPISDVEVTGVTMLPLGSTKMIWALQWLETVRSITSGIREDQRGLQPLPRVSQKQLSIWGTHTHAVRALHASAGSREAVAKTPEEPRKGLGEVQQPSRHWNTQQQIVTDCTNSGLQEQNEQETKIQQSSYTVAALKGS